MCAWGLILNMKDRRREQNRILKTIFHVYLHASNSDRAKPMYIPFVEANRVNHSRLPRLTAVVLTAGNGANDRQPCCQCDRHAYDRVVNQVPTPPLNSLGPVRACCSGYSWTFSVRASSTNQQSTIVTIGGYLELMPCSEF